MKDKLKESFFYKNKEQNKKSIKRDFKRYLFLLKTSLSKEINNKYDRIKGCKDFNVYYKELHDLIKKFFIQEYLYTHEKFPYPDFEEEMVEDFFINWKKQNFSLCSREKKKKDYKTLFDKLSGDEIKRIDYYLNQTEERKAQTNFDKYIISFEDYKKFGNKIPSIISKYEKIDEIVEYEFSRLYEKNQYLVYDNLDYNIFVFISLFFGSFDLEYVSSNFFMSLSKNDFFINALKCKVMEMIKRIERRCYDEGDEKVC